MKDTNQIEPARRLRALASALRALLLLEEATMNTTSDPDAEQEVEDAIAKFTKRYQLTREEIKHSKNLQHGN